MPLELPVFTLADAAGVATPNVADVRKGDASTYAQRFTPRTTARSTWSQRNVAHIARLEQEGRMTGSRTPGSATRRKRTGGGMPRTLAQSTAEPPAEFPGAPSLRSLRRRPCREKRIAAFVEMPARGETMHPQRQKQKQKQKQKQAQTAKAPTALAGATATAPNARVSRAPASHDAGDVRRCTRLSKMTAGS
ncbi:Uu.00g036800.m01.CDS01 [Anthostomella pinea]|uniref:Uu.00g036800.m01.CDS01 n=1 Tax=Anthostomella pinea TaxID=933095 RepID=A0AAI8VA07_9PEZI|nr:Uu.00g036800.m01.CDS01 [Anthostomella pinea]